jgi:hypothetical protein
MRRPNVLLVGESLNQYSYLAQRLTSWGGECRFAISHKHVCALVGQQSFEMVISEMNLVDGSALRMSPLLEGSRSSLFCFYPVRVSCLWIPIMERGQICWGAPALRPNEFGRVLRRALTEGCRVTISEVRIAESPASPSPSPSQSSIKPRQLAKAG